jgi:hypothetical protein
VWRGSTDSSALPDLSCQTTQTLRTSAQLTNLYFLGWWLGDGTRSSTTIYNNHEKGRQGFLAKYAAGLDLFCVYGKGISYRITSMSSKIMN